MQITRVPGTEPRKDHDALTNALKRCAFDGGGKDMVVGVRNHSGAIYLKITTVGMAEFFNVVNCLDSREFDDELAESTRMKDGCDAIFSKT